MGAGSSKKDEPEKVESVQNNYDEKKRTNVAKEIVETERSYVNNLETLCKVFLVPLKEAAETDHPILTTNEIKGIFGIIEVIANFHATLLGELDERMKKWDSTSCMGDIFAKNNAFFKMISTYVNGYNQALLTYMQCKQKEKQFAQFLDKVMTSKTTNLMDLQSYLIMPVQRLPRYVLLLTELVKYSNVKHPGYPSLCQSLQAVKGVAEFVNEAKRNAENSLKMLQIQEILVGKRARPILEPTRKFYGEGHFVWFNSRRKEPRPLQYFLFYDSILLATPEKSFFQSTPDRLKLKVLAPLVTVELQEIPDSTGKVARFDIQTPNKTFTVVWVDGENDMDKWIKEFYWLKSGCGPRYEIVNAEAQKRHFIKSDTHEIIAENLHGSKKIESPKVETAKPSPKVEAKNESKPITTSKSDSKTDLKASSGSTAPKNDKPNSPPTPALKNSSDATKNNLKESASKPAAPTATNAPSPPSSAAVKGKEGKAESPKIPANNEANKPQPPSSKDSAKKPAAPSPTPPPSSTSPPSPSPSPPSTPATAPERRPSLTTSLSAFFGIGTPNATATANNNTSNNNANTNNSKGDSNPSSPRSAPVKPPAKK